MADIPEEVRARMVPMSADMQIVQRYASEEKQWPRDMPHPSGKRPVVVDYVLQHMWADPQASISDVVAGLAAVEWRDVRIVPGVQGLPTNHEYTTAERLRHAVLMRPGPTE